jgi:hypothetical protein
MQEIINQVEGEFVAHDFPLILPRLTINKYVPNGCMGEFPTTQGMEGSMHQQCFNVLVLAVEPFMQTSQVNGVALMTKIMTMKINKWCGIELTLKRPNHMMHNCVMKVMTVLLNPPVATPVEESCVRWTTYINLLK